MSTSPIYLPFPKLGKKLKLHSAHLQDLLFQDSIVIIHHPDENYLVSSREIHFICKMFDNYSKIRYDYNDTLQFNNSVNGISPAYGMLFTCSGDADYHVDFILDKLSEYNIDDIQYEKINCKEIKERIREEFLSSIFEDPTAVNN